MTFPQLVASSVFLGTPLAIIVRWVVLARWSGRFFVPTMAIALGLWILQAAVFFAAVLSCIGGHCQADAVLEYVVMALMAGAFLAIALLFWLSRRP